MPPYIAGCALGDKIIPGENHLLGVHIHSNQFYTFHTTRTILNDNQRLPSPHMLQDHEMSKDSITLLPGTYKGKCTALVLQSISTELITKRIF